MLVAEAPPSAADRYFYFEYVADQDSLFRDVCQEVLGYRPGRNAKPAALAQLQDAGVFLIDLSFDSVDDQSRRLMSHLVPDLISRCLALSPDRIILIKANVYDLTFEPLRAAGLPVVDERIPFPVAASSGASSSRSSGRIVQPSPNPPAPDERRGSRTAWWVPCAAAR
jgi:hypothetical protein